MKNWLDSIWFGFLCGIMAPVSLFFFFYVTKHHAMGLEAYLRMIAFEGTLVERMSLCVILNLVVFYLFLWKHKYKSARGVILATFLYAGWVAYKKVF